MNLLRGAVGAEVAPERPLSGVDAEVGLQVTVLSRPEGTVLTSKLLVSSTVGAAVTVNLRCNECRKGAFVALVTERRDLRNGYHWEHWRVPWKN